MLLLLKFIFALINIQIGKNRVYEMVCRLVDLIIVMLVSFAHFVRQFVKEFNYWLK